LKSKISSALLAFVSSERGTFSPIHHCIGG
jgi:hypothetical protein